MVFKEKLTSVGDVCDIVILQVQDLLGVLDDGRRIGSHKVLDRLGHSILGEESPGLGSPHLRVGTSRGRGKEGRSGGFG